MALTTSASNERIEVEQAFCMPVRVYMPGRVMLPAPIALHLHGGAFVEGSLDSGRTVAGLLADAGAFVVSADYPVGPAHPFPHALQAVSRLLAWVYRHRAKWGSKASQIFVAGEEAGGNLAAGLALMARDQQTPPLAGQILISPMLDPTMATCSVRKAEAGPVGCKWADGWHRYLGSADKASHPYAAPLGSSRLASVAPALVLTAEDDPMRDESLGYARRLRSAGVPVMEHVLAGPTGWPCALTRAGGNGAPWMEAARRHMSEFFEQTLTQSRCGCMFTSLKPDPTLKPDF